MQPIQKRPIVNRKLHHWQQHDPSLINEPHWSSQVARHVSFPAPLCTHSLLWLLKHTFPSITVHHVIRADTSLLRATQSGSDKVAHRPLAVQRTFTWIWLHWLSVQLNILIKSNKVITSAPAITSTEKLMECETGDTFSHYDVSVYACRKRTAPEWL